MSTSAAARNTDTLHGVMDKLTITEHRGAAVVGGDADASSVDTTPTQSRAHPNTMTLMDGFTLSTSNKGEYRGTVMLSGFKIPVMVVIDQITYEADINFVYAATQYTFCVTKWSRNGMRTFLGVFHDHADRDPDVFGDINGFITGSQKRNCVLRASIDVMVCLDKIATQIQASVLDYAVHYRERVGSYGTYSKYITTVTCHNIIHSHFSGANIPWPIIEL